MPRPTPNPDPDPDPVPAPGRVPTGRLVGSSGSPPERLPSDFKRIVAMGATPDIVCWLLAAVRPRADGGVDVVRAAQVLGVSRSSVYRWIATAREREFDPQARATLARYAVLRGHGDYLWPPLDDASRVRQEAYLSQAHAGVRNLTERPDLYAGWKSATTPAQVFTFHHAAAKVYGVGYATKPTTLRRLGENGATLLEAIPVPTVMHAKLLKYTILDLAGEHRCIAPRELIPNSRTEVWTQRGGDVDLTAVWAQTVNTIQETP